MTVAKNSSAQTTQRTRVRMPVWSWRASSMLVGKDVSVSTGKPTSIDVKDAAVHVVGVARSEVEARAGDRIGLGPGALRNARQDRRVADRVFAQRSGVLGLDVTRRDGVDVDPLLRPLIRQRLGDARDPVLRRRVRGDEDPALEAEQRRDVDDAEAIFRR